MRRARLALLVPMVLLLAGCGGARSAPAGLHGHALDPPFRVSAAPLTDTSGERYSLTTSTRRPLTLVYFGYTHCTDVCALVMGNLASAMTRLDDRDRARVHLVSLFDVFPPRDPRVAKARAKLSSLLF